MYQFRKGLVDEKHLYFQMRDGTIIEADAAPPAIATAQISDSNNPWGGEDPIYLARRLLRMASEDIGLADPQALPLAVAALQSVRVVGLPECVLALAEVAVYLSLAPKSNALYSKKDSAVFCKPSCRHEFHTIARKAGKQLALEM